MISKLALAALAATGAILLAGCGGGSEDSAAAAFSQPLRKPAPELCAKDAPDTGLLRYRSVDGVCTAVLAPAAPSVATPASSGAPQRAAHAPFTWSTFLTWAASAYPQFFTGSSQDGVYGEYTYRYWPATGHFLALAGTESLYVMGPATHDQIMYIGRLSELLCFVYPANCAPASTDIPGNTATTAALGLNVPASSTIDHADDEDWFAVDLAAGTTYTFRMQGSSAGKGTLSDPSLGIHNAAGIRVAYNDDANYPADLNSLIQYTPAAAGRYYVAAGSFDATGTYEVSVSAGSGTGGTGGTGGSGGTGSTGGTDIRGDTATTSSLTFPSVATSTIGAQDDQDWFAVDLVAGTAYTFHLEGAGTSAGTLPDPYLRLHNASGTSVGSNDDISYPSNLNARIQYTPTTGGRYYVAALAFQGTGTYQLTVSASGGTGGTGGTGGRPALTTSVTGTGQGTVSPASGSYSVGEIVTVSPQPQFFSEFAGWTAASTGCPAGRHPCRLTMDTSEHMEARFEPAVFETSFDTNYAAKHLNACEWHITWSNTRIALTYTLSNGSYVGRLRITGRRAGTVTREYPGWNCIASDRTIDASFDIGPQAAGAGAYARVRSFDGAGDEYLTLSTFELPGPTVGVGSFVPGQITLEYTGTNRSGSTSLPVITLMRLPAAQ